MNRTFTLFLFNLPSLHACPVVRPFIQCRRGPEIELFVLYLACCPTINCRFLYSFLLNLFLYISIQSINGLYLFSLYMNFHHDVYSSLFFTQLNALQLFFPLFQQRECNYVIFLFYISSMDLPSPPPDLVLRKR